MSCVRRVGRHSHNFRTSSPSWEGSGREVMDTDGTVTVLWCLPSGGRGGVDGETYGSSFFRYSGRDRVFGTTVIVRESRVEYPGTPTGAVVGQGVCPLTPVAAGGRGKQKWINNKPRVERSEPFRETLTSRPTVSTHWGPAPTRLLFGLPFPVFPSQTRFLTKDAQDCVLPKDC